mmetsp:Transcript_12678/g.26202  ORF Transcript_12678/g.26202 Transcript_12678/m.26202 type:complete len:255 (+) Transcript_12678:1129-1893(+)
MPSWRLPPTLIIRRESSSMPPSMAMPVSVAWLASWVASTLPTVATTRPSTLSSPPSRPSTRTISTAASPPATPATSVRDSPGTTSTATTRVPSLWIFWPTLRTGGRRRIPTTTTSSSPSPTPGASPWTGPSSPDRMSGTCSSSEVSTPIPSISIPPSLTRSTYARDAGTTIPSRRPTSITFVVPSGTSTLRISTSLDPVTPGLSMRRSRHPTRCPLSFAPASSVPSKTASSLRFTFAYPCIPRVIRRRRLCRRS